mmetsp:Transcript_29980/g.95699  ORF Transcript_29980/g.95699 Transcript_29980/m.95699 type:complete len:272 (-) Transcript_29980:610-1425(-)
MGWCEAYWHGAAWHPPAGWSHGRRCLVSLIVSMGHVMGILRVCCLHGAQLALEVALHRAMHVSSQVAVHLALHVGLRCLCKHASTCSVQRQSELSAKANRLGRHMGHGVWTRGQHSALRCGQRRRKHCARRGEVGGQLSRHKDPAMHVHAVCARQVCVRKSGRQSKVGWLSIAAPICWCSTGGRGADWLTHADRGTVVVRRLRRVLDAPMCHCGVRRLHVRLHPVCAGAAEAFALRRRRRSIWLPTTICAILSRDTLGFVTQVAAEINAAR